MKTFVSILALLGLVAVASAGSTCGVKGSGSRIINGVDAGHGEFPWQISLRYRNYGHICGGTIIGNKWILCAAHCFGQSKNARDYTIRIGEWKLKSRDGTEKDHPVRSIRVNARYNSPQQFANDISVLELATPIDLSGPYATPACLPMSGKDYRAHQNCQLSGWGLVKRYPQTLADQLQKITGKIWTLSGLKQQYGWGLPDGVVGFGEPGRWSACMGDSGGPLICPNGSGSAFDVIGVVSFGPGTCSGKPGVFTEVAAPKHRAWIKSQTGL